MRLDHKLSCYLDNCMISLVSLLWEKTDLTLPSLSTKVFRFKLCEKTLNRKAEEEMNFRLLLPAHSAPYGRLHALRSGTALRRPRTRGRQPHGHADGVRHLLGDLSPGLPARNVWKSGNGRHHQRGSAQLLGVHQVRQCRQAGPAQGVCWLLAGRTHGWTVLMGAGDLSLKWCVISLRHP